jgi:hypothetical protein
MICLVCSRCTTAPDRLHGRVVGLPRRRLKVVKLDVLRLHLTQMQPPDHLHPRALVRLCPPLLHGTHQRDVVTRPAGRLVAERVQVAEITGQHILSGAWSICCKR